MSEICGTRLAENALGIGPHSSLWPPYVIGQAIHIFILSFVMVALWNRADHYIFALCFLLSSSFFFLFFLA